MKIATKSSNKKNRNSNSDNNLITKASYDARRMDQAMVKVDGNVIGQKDAGGELCKVLRTMPMIMANDDATRTCLRRIHTQEILAEPLRRLHNDQVIHARESRANLCAKSYLKAH